jgi:dTDP-4-amino-4,6-dideoxygalactose transaminase
MRLMKNFGFADYDEVVHVGTNGKMTEIAAAMGLTSLESLDEFIGVNQRNYRLYHQHLAGIPGVTQLSYDEGEANNYQYIVIELDEAVAGLGRDALQAVLQAENVLARRYFYPGCHRMEPYRSRFPHVRLPATDRVASRVLTLPTGTAVGPEEIATVCRIVRLAAEYGAQVMDRVRDRRKSFDAV